jgi:predicted neuraminidase
MTIRFRASGIRKCDRNAGRDFYKSTFRLNMTRENFRDGVIGLVILIAFVAAFFKVAQYPSSTAFQTSFIPIPVHRKPRFQTDFASSKLHIQHHAASLIELKDGSLRAFWFSGSREGAEDVEIHSAVFNPARARWSTERVVATREDTEKSVLRYVRKLGNPVCGRAADGKLWLFYVTVSMGGWSGSSLTAKVSADEGKTWSAARRLVTSAFLNISTLVKGTPFLYRDGTMGVPVYQELASKMGEILRIDRTGKVVDLQRLSAGKDDGLQPVLLVKSTFNALALMRNSGTEQPRPVLAVSTPDGGRHWTKPRKLPLSNPDSALSAVVLPDRRILAVVNNRKRQGISNGRDALSLMISADNGETWKLVDQLEDQSAMRGRAHDQSAYLRIVRKQIVQSNPGMDEAAVAAGVESTKSAMCDAQGCRFEFSYPYLIQARNGDFHLVYTWNRSFIKHVWFNLAWIDQRLKSNDGVH